MERHGQTDTPEYQAWCNIKNRCHNPESREYPSFGGKGIRMSERWRQSFAEFLRDVGKRPSPKHQLRRDDLTGDYSQENCRWTVENKSRFKDFTNQKFGRLTAVAPIKKPWSSKYYWRCKCDCGREVEVLGSNLSCGNTTSCGCYGRGRLGEISMRHGMSKSRIFKIWAGIRKRCNNPKMKSYDRYGGRGIKVCPQWDAFIGFYNDMRHGYADHLTLERINPDGDYEPNNCRWATMKEQARNKRNTKLIECGGEARTAAEWEEITGANRTTIGWRLKRGWTSREAIYGKAEDTTLEEISMYLVF